MKEVEAHTCRSCTFQIQKMRHKPMEKNFCLLPLKNQRKTSSFVLLAFLVLLSPASLFSSLFSFTVTKGSKKKNLYVPLLSVFSLPASVAFFFSFFSCFFSALFFACFSLIFSALFLLFLCAFPPLL